jgi:hypothetical protein
LMIPRWCGAVTTLGIFLLGSKPASKFQPEAERTLALLMAVGELHGRNLASALMRSCVHNRTRGRGGKPIRLAWPWAFPPVLPKDRGALSPKNRVALSIRAAVSSRWRCWGANCGQGNRCGGSARTLPCTHRANRCRPFFGRAAPPRCLGASRASIAS